MTTTTTRRAILAGAASAVATSSPALTTPITAVDGSAPDAELVALGGQLEAIIREWHAQRTKDARNSAAREAMCVRAGLPQIDRKSVSGEEYVAYQEKRLNITKEAPDYWDDVDEDGCSIAWTDIHDRLYPVVEDILDLTAHTKAGLAVQAHAWRIGDEALFDKQDPDTQSMYGPAFIEAVYRFVGVEPLDLSTDTAAVSS